MTSPNQSRRISPRRLLRDKLKRLYFAFYKLGVRLGVYILPAHEYVSEPNIIKLERTVDVWAKPSAMAEIYIDLDEQIDNLRRVSARFQEEFFGNQHYQYAVKHAVNQSFRSGRSSASDLASRSAVGKYTASDLTRSINSRKTRASVLIILQMLIP